MLDTIVNSILGRAGGLPALNQDLRPRRLSHQIYDTAESGREKAIQAIFDICPFMDELEQKECNQDTASTEGFLHRLQEWSKALPQELRRSTEVDGPMSATIDSEVYIGGTHVACVYYFAVILATRRFFTVFLLDQIRDPSSANTPSTPAKVDEKTSNLAYVCTNGAVSLAKVGHNAMITDQMLNNMCLLK